MTEARERFEQALSRARAVQWERSPSQDTEARPRKSNGPISNPTADIALDLRRLAVRDAVQKTERYLEAQLLFHLPAELVDLELSWHTENLETAIRIWEGEDAIPHENHRDRRPS